MIELDDTGVTFATKGATWFTPWHLIDNARASKSAVLVATGGITFSIPKSEIGDKEAVAGFIDTVSARVSHA